MRGFAVLLAVGALLVTAQPAFAAVGQHDASLSCTEIWNSKGNPKPFVCLSENTFHGGDHLTLTGSSDIASLTMAHTLTGWCAPKLIGDSDNWNDCISSVWAKLGTSDSFCMYSNINYDNMWNRFVAPGSPSGATFTYSIDDLGGIKDWLSSVMLQQSGQPCSEGGA
jgi:hypothetical protein